MPIRQFDHSTIRKLRKELENALQAIATKHDLDISIGKARFGLTAATFKLDVVTKDMSGQAQTRDRQTFQRCASAYGLDPIWLDQEFEFNGEKYRITGLNTRAVKYPVHAEKVSDGSKYKFPAFRIAQVMKGK